MAGAPPQIVQATPDGRGAVQVTDLNMRAYVLWFDGPGLVKQDDAGNWHFTPKADVDPAELRAALGWAAPYITPGAIGSLQNPYGDGTPVPTDSNVNAGVLNGGSPAIGGEAVTGPGPGGGADLVSVETAANGGVTPVALLTTVLPGPQVDWLAVGVVVMILFLMVSGGRD